MDMGDKPAFKSVTVWGGILIAISQLIPLVVKEFGDVIPPDWLGMLTGLGTVIGSLMGILGIRRAVGSAK